MKRLMLFFALSVFSIIGLSSFQQASEKVVQCPKDDQVIIVVNTDGYYGELYFDNATDQFLSGNVSKAIPNGGGAYRMYTITSVTGNLSRSLINNQVTHFDGVINGTAGISYSVTLTLDSSNNAALTSP